MDEPGKSDLVKDDKGVWSYTTEPISSELYNYSFIVDGFKTTDPSNPFVIRDVANLTNIFIIGDGKADFLYDANKEFKKNWMIWE